MLTDFRVRSTRYKRRRISSTLVRVEAVNRDWIDGWAFSPKSSYERWVYQRGLAGANVDSGCAF